MIERHSQDPVPPSAFPGSTAIKDNSRSSRRIWLLLGLGVLSVHVFLWWNTSPKLEYDAKNFWDYSQLFKTDGFRHALLQTVPPREPGYPLFLYAISRAAGTERAPHVVSGIQFVLLLLTACFAASLASQWRVPRIVPYATFVSVALSPALLNTAQTLYAETFACFFFSLWVWGAVHAVSQNPGRVQRAMGVFSAIAGSALILSRPTYLHIVAVSLVGWFFILWRHATFEGTFLLKGAVYGVLVFTLPVLWMERNLHTDGLFNLADHAGVVLKGRYEKSLEPYRAREILGAALNAASESVCHSVFSDCERYSFDHANAYGYAASREMQEAEHLTTARANQKLFKQTMHRIVLTHPVRFALFGVFELIQLTFFETLSTGASQSHSRLLSRVESSGILRGAVHLGLSIFYALGVWGLLFSLATSRNGPQNSFNANVPLQLTLVPLGGHFLVYMMATCVIRYSFVIAPLYIAVAWTGWWVVLRNRRKI
jgi:hypothetical protein